MNEMSPPGRPAAVPPTYQSEDIGLLVEALAEAQKSITNPVKNREVEVYMRKTGGTYRFSYATFDQILNILRGPLAENGLVFTQLYIGRQLVSLLAHKSGQWLKTVNDVSYDGGLQDLGSALSYLKRYAALGMFGLSAEDDDDGIAASGDREIVTREEAAARKAEIEARQRRREETGTILHPIQEMARLVKDAGGGMEVMRQWMADAEEIDGLRQDAEWPTFLNEVAAAIHRALGKTAAVAWKSGAMATKPEQMRAVDVQWQGAWAADMKRLEQDQPEAHRTLVAHLKARLAALTADPSAPPPPPREPPKAPPPQHTRTPAPATPQASEDPSAGLFAEHVLDALGEACTDLITDPQEWADAYFKVLETADGDDLENLRHHNIDSIARAVVSGVLNKDALDALNGVLERAEPKSPEPPADAGLVLQIPKTPLGGPNLTAYLRAVAIALDGKNLAEIRQWQRANQPQIGDLPQSGQDAVTAEIQRHIDRSQKGGK